jgi:protein-serine/threonine kinase
MNPLLTRSARPALPPVQTPLIKLTDFGLSRIIDPADPWLATRCGSESYAAPELLIAVHSEDADAPETNAPLLREGRNEGGNVTPRRAGTYDGRETDAWALGVVLYSLVTRRLPFDERDGGSSAHGDSGSRRAWLMRIARGEWDWPNASELVPPSDADLDDGHSSEDGAARPPVLRGTGLALLPAVRSIVSRLLVRDPRRRARVAELWDEDWMRFGEGAVYASLDAAISAS